jgi:hypothetical protein
MIAYTLAAHPLSITAGIRTAAIFQIFFFFAFHIQPGLLLKKRFTFPVAKIL